VDIKAFGVDFREHIQRAFRLDAGDARDLLQEKVLLVQGTAFNWPWPDHVRIVTLPREDDLEVDIKAFGVDFREHIQRAFRLDAGDARDLVD
jgi:aspartate/methionine/tyrosine aminotransferase